MIGRMPLLLSSILMIAACTEQGPDDPTSGRSDSVPGEETVACAIGPGSDFASRCPVERATSEDGNVLVVRHPGGGFRRFLLDEKGAGLTALDGADVARGELQGGMLVLSVGEDRYRFPARKIGADEPG